jgi:hypothetical protein
MEGHTPVSFRNLVKEAPIVIVVVIAEVAIATVTVPETVFGSKRSQ